MSSTDRYRTAAVKPPNADQTDPPLWMLRLLSRSTPIKRLLGRMMGLGFRREHIRAAEHA